MTKDEIIKATGSITKEEELIDIPHHIMPNTMVLESAHPFPGYHGDNIPESLTTNSIYLITDSVYDGEDIMRASKKIKKIIPYSFSASFGNARIQQYLFHFIRLLDLECSDCISSIQEAYAAEGINFLRKRPIKGEALIKLQKFFSFQKLDQYIYRDLDNPLMYYFEIPYKPEWNFFKKITYYIRGNIDNLTYDAALGSFYLEEIHDIIRIFEKDMTVEQLNFIRKKYMYELTHPDHLG